MFNKTNNPLVSIIIPTYNRAWILKQAIDSVFAQDYDNFELIVVDDGSTDNTCDILNSYNQENFKIIYQENKVVSSARNKGISLAKGDFIAFLDSDDLWLAKKLSAQIEFFNLNPDALICQTEEIWIRNGIRVNPKKKHKKPSGMIFEPCLLLCLVSPSAVMMKKNLFDSTGLFDENLPACEDYDLWLRISCKYPVYLIDKPLIIKRGGHQDQLSKSWGLDKYRIQSIKKLIENNLLSDANYKSAIKVLKEKCKIYAKGCQKRGRNNEALEYLRLSENYPCF